MEVINKSNNQESNLVVRETFVKVRLELSQDFAHPEKVVLQLDRKTKVNPIDIGGLAYTNRQPQKNNHLAHLPHMVDESSFMPSRRKLLVVLHDYIATTGNNDNTVKFHLDNYAAVIDWLDQNGHSNAFENEFEARQGYKAYVDELNHQIKSVDLNKITPRAANVKQRAMINLLELYWGDDAANEIIREIPVIKFKRKEGGALEERNVRFATRTFLHLARGFKTFSMEKKPFPYLLKMPDYECYVFPSNGQACVTPYQIDERYSYHYQEGRISTPEEYMMKCPRNIGLDEATREVEKSQENLKLVNANMCDVNRLNYASLALKSYMQLFILMTGINPSELVQLEYDEDFTLEKDLLKNDFRAIKVRAAGRVVSYHLGNRKGLEIFKEYIELRNWVLNGENYPYLFFNMEKIGQFTGNPLQYNKSNVTRIYRNTRGRFFPESFVAISSSKVRKYKTSVWNELNISQGVIADNLNHKQKTNHSYYAVSSPDKQQSEFGLFFESAQAAAKRIPIKLVVDNDSDKSIAAGHCEDFQHPEAMEDKPPIAPGCSVQMGCLYCEQYVCHADEEDIKKLYSLLYVINAVRDMATDFNHSDKLLLELTMRIQFVLNQMSAISEAIQSLVNEIKEDVMEDGMLTPFWEFRLQRYEQMGVIV